MLTLLRSAIGNLTHLLRLSSGKKWNVPPFHDPKERLTTPEFKEIGFLTMRPPHTVCSYADDLLHELENALRMVDQLIRKSQQPELIFRFPDLVSRRWLICARIYREGFDASGLTRWCILGLEMVDERLLESMEKEIDEAIVRQKEEMTDLPPPAFRIDILTELFIAAGLPIEGMSTPQDKPSPETDASPCYYYQLSDGKYLRVFLKSGNLLSVEQKDTLTRVVKEHEGKLKRHESLFRSLILTVKKVGIEMSSIRYTPDEKALVFFPDRLFFVNYDDGFLEMRFAKALSQQQRLEIENIIKANRPIKEILSSGETTRIEYKSTLRTNLHTGQPDKKMEQACLKTIAAFLNSQGGNLLIGVSDNGEVLGIENDNFPNEDRMNLHLINLLKDRLGPQHMLYIEPRFEDLDGKRVLVVCCKPSNLPVYLKEGNTEQFFIRTGPATTEMRASEMQQYIQFRFSGGQPSETQIPR